MPESGYDECPFQHQIWVNNCMDHHQHGTLIWQKERLLSGEFIGKVKLLFLDGATMYMVGWYGF